MKKIISTLVVFCVLFSLSVPAFAAETPQIILDSRDAILKINSYYDVDKNNYYGSGTGFLVKVGDEGGASKIVCTNWHVVTNLNEESSEYGKALPSVNIVSNRDVEINAEILYASERANFAIIKLQNPIYNRTPLVLADSKTLKASETVYALGFPDIVEGIKDDSSYRPENVSITSGNISKISAIDNMPMIQHTAIINIGSSGSPLLTEDGRVVGINTIKATDYDNAPSLFYAVSISEIRNTLDDLSFSGDPHGQIELPPELPPESHHTAFIIGVVLFLALTIATFIVLIYFRKKTSE